MKKLSVILIPCLFLGFALGGCKKTSVDPPEFTLFDFHLLDKNTNQSVVGVNGQPYHRDSIKIRHVTAAYPSDENLSLEYILAPGPVSGYYFRNIPIYGFMGPDYNEIYHLYLNKTDTDTIRVDSNGSADGRNPSVKFYYNGKFIAKRNLDGNGNNRPILEFKK